MSTKETAKDDDGMGCLFFIGVGLFGIGVGSIYGAGAGFIATGAPILILLLIACLS